MGRPAKAPSRASAHREGVELITLPHRDPARAMREPNLRLGIWEVGAVIVGGGAGVTVEEVLRMLTGSVFVAGAIGAVVGLSVLWLARFVRRLWNQPMERYADLAGAYERVLEALEEAVGKRNAVQRALSEATDSAPCIEAELTTTTTGRGDTGYVIRVRNTGEKGVFRASMDLSGQYYTLTGHHRMCWTRSGGEEAELPHNDEDYIHLADCGLMGAEGCELNYRFNLFHWNPLASRKEPLGSIGYVPGQGPEVRGVARVTISTEPKARGGAWTEDIHFTVRGMTLGPFPNP